MPLPVRLQARLAQGSREEGGPCLPGREKRHRATSSLGTITQVKEKCDQGYMLLLAKGYVTLAFGAMKIQVPTAERTRLPVFPK